MGRYDDIVRDIAQSVAGVRDTIVSDVGAFLMQGFTEEGHATQIFKSNSQRYFTYVLDTVTGDVIERYNDQIIDYMGNILADVEALTVPEDPADPCYQIPPVVDKTDLMNLHKAGYDFNIRKINAVLYADFDTGCRRPYNNSGTSEAHAYFESLAARNIIYEFTPEMFTEPTPHAQDEQVSIAISSGGTRFKWDNALKKWVDFVTGIPIPETPDTMTLPQYGVMVKQPYSESEFPIWVSYNSGQMFYVAPLSAQARMGALYPWSEVRSQKDEETGRTWFIVPVSITPLSPGGVASSQGETGGRVGDTGSVGGRKDEPGAVVSPGATVSPGGLVSSGKTVTPADMVMSWMGAAPETGGEYPDYIKEALTRLGVRAPKNWMDWLGIVAMTMVGTFARLSNEPIDRAIRQYLNEEMPNALPNPTDLVRFELREVFRPEDREKALEVPPSRDFLKYMGQWGFDPYHSESYWAAHWELPSPIQAYEMFHRLRPSKFTPDLAYDRAALRKTLQVLDYRPDYIDKLIEIAYQPITRVDIRRMWNMGVIRTESDLLGRYLDLGYHPDDAKIMVEYTMKDAEPTEKTLSKAFYETEFLEGRLSFGELIEAYNTMGYRPEDSRRMADSLLRKQQRTTEQETNRRETGARSDKMLTSEQTIKAFKLGIIDEETAYHKLVRYGYDKNDADILLTIAYVEMSAPYEVEKQLEKAERKTIFDITQAFIKGETTEEEARSELQTIGRDPAEITALLNVAKTQQR